MSNGTVPAVYSFVILDVIQKMQPRFAELGIDDQTLLQLQKNWELKIRTLQIAPFTSNLGVGGLRNEFEFNAVLNGAFHSPVLIHKNVPQNDGVDLDAGIDSNAESLDASLQMAADLSTEAAAGIPLHASTAKKGGNRPGKRVVQFDGLEDDEDDEADDDEDNPDSINSDLDDPDSESEGLDTDNLILCQYEKVTRVKNKWKCVLKDGIVNVNGKDYLFHRAAGDFEW